MRKVLSVQYQSGRILRSFVMPAFLVFIDHQKTFLIELPGEDPLADFPVRIRPDDLRQSPHRLPRYGLPPSRIPVHGAVFCRFHPSFFASYLHHKTYPVLLWIHDKVEGSLPGNFSDPFPVVLFSYGYVGMEVLPPQQVPGQTDRSSFLPHQRRTADRLWNPEFLCVFRNDSC